MLYALASIILLLFEYSITTEYHVIVVCHSPLFMLLHRYLKKTTKNRPTKQTGHHALSTSWDDPAVYVDPLLHHRASLLRSLCWSISNVSFAITLSVMMSLLVCLSLCVCADTSLTNFSAFMLGSLTALPAVEYFCLYAGTAILFDFVLQVDAPR